MDIELKIYIEYRFWINLLSFEVWPLNNLLLNQYVMNIHHGQTVDVQDLFPTGPYLDRLAQMKICNALRPVWTRFGIHATWGGWAGLMDKMTKMLSLVQERRWDGVFLFKFWKSRKIHPLHPRYGPKKSIPFIQGIIQSSLKLVKLTPGSDECGESPRRWEGWQGEPQVPCRSWIRQLPMGHDRILFLFGTDGDARPQ